MSSSIQNLGVQPLSDPGIHWTRLCPLRRPGPRAAGTWGRSLSLGSQSSRKAAAMSSSSGLWMVYGGLSRLIVVKNQLNKGIHQHHCTGRFLLATSWVVIARKLGICQKTCEGLLWCHANTLLIHGVDMAQCFQVLPLSSTCNEVDRGRNSSRQDLRTIKPRPLHSCCGTCNHHWPWSIKHDQAAHGCENGP